MNKIQIHTMGIEITRKCNMRCDFCMRGKAQKLSISDNVINQIFNVFLSNFETVYIENINLTGGEPFLEPIKIVKIINELIKRKINVGFFTITTNGSIYNDDIVSVLNLMNKYAEFGVGLRISADTHHIIHKDKLKANIEKFEQNFKGKLNVQVDIPILLPSGYENSNNVPPNHDVFISFWDGTQIFVPSLFITSCGKISDTGDYSYEQVDKFNFGVIGNILLDETFMDKKVHGTKIGEQLNFGIPISKNKK